MVKKSLVKHHVQSQSPRLCSSPTHQGAHDSSRTLCTRQTSAHVRQSRGLASLRNNYSQLLQEFAEWSVHNPANKQHTLPGSDGAIMPDASVACTASTGTVSQGLQQQVTTKGTAVLRLGSTSPKPGLSRQQTAADAMDSASSPQPQQLMQVSQQHSDVSNTAAAKLAGQLKDSQGVEHRDHARLRSAAAAASKRSSKQHGTATSASATSPGKGRRKSKPRPAWRNSIDVSSTQQRQHDTASQDSPGQPLSRLEVAADQLSPAASSTPAVQQPTGTGNAYLQQQASMESTSVGDTQHCSHQHHQQQQGAEREQPDPVAHEEQQAATLDVQGQAGLAYAVAETYSAITDIALDTAISMPAAAAAGRMAAPAAEEVVEQPQQQLAEAVAATAAAPLQHVHSFMVDLTRSGISVVAGRAGPPAASALDSECSSTPRQQQQKQERAKAKRLRVRASCIPSAPQAAGVAATVGSVRQTPQVPSRVPLLPLQQLQSTNAAASEAGQVSTATAGSGHMASCEVATAGPTGGRDSSSSATTRQHSDPIQLSANSSVAAAGRRLSSELPDLLPGGLTHRRHSAADAEQEMMEATLSPAGATTLRQIGLAVAAQLGSSSSNMGASASDPLQHIKQLQALRRRSVGPQHNEPGSMLSCTTNTASTPCAADSSSLAAGLPLLPAIAGSCAGSEDMEYPLLQHRRTSSQGGSAPTSSRGSSGQKPPARNSSSAGATPRGIVSAGSAGGITALPELRPSRTGSRRSSSSQLPTLEEGAALRCAVVSVVAGQSGLPSVAPAGSRRGSRTDDHDSSNSAGHGTDQSNSSGSRRPMLHSSSMAMGSSNTPTQLCKHGSSSSQHVVVENVGNSSSGGNSHGFADAEISYGLDEPTIHRRSSSDDDSTGVPALGYEVSSYGVCGNNPAGAVQLLRAAIPDRLARLKTRMNSKHLTTDDDGQPVEPVADVALDSIGGQVSSSMSWPGTAPAAPEPAAACATAAVEGAEGAITLQHTAHHGHRRSTGSADYTGSHGQHTAADRPQRGMIHTMSEHRLPVQQQQQQRVPSGRVRARWQIPDCDEADKPQQQPAVSDERMQQEPSPQVIHRLPQQQQQQQQHQQQQEHMWPHQEPWQLHQFGQLQSSGHPLAHPLPARAWSCKQPAPWEHQQHVHQQYSQHGRLGGSHSFHTMQAQQHQQHDQYLQQQQHWTQQQHQGPEQCRTMLNHVPQMGQQYFPDQQQPCRQQQQMPPTMQQWGQTAPWMAWQQQQLPQQVQSGPSNIVPGTLPPLSYVPPPQSMETYQPQLPNIDGRRQLMQPLSTYHSPAAGPDSAGACTNPPTTGPSTSSSAASATAAALTALSATAASMSGPGGLVATIPASGALSRFSDPWAEKQQQQQQARQEQQERQQQQQVTSAAAMARQRQEAQEVAFKGLSLEAVLKTAKKPKPPPCVVRNRHSAPDAEPAAS